VLAMELIHRNARRIELKPLAGSTAEIVIAAVDIEWMARIVWSSQ
jgi:hypothetical protein